MKQTSRAAELSRRLSRCPPAGKPHVQPLQQSRPIERIDLSTPPLRGRGVDWCRAAVPFGGHRRCRLTKAPCQASWFRALTRHRCWACPQPHALPCRREQMPLRLRRPRRGRRREPKSLFISRLSVSRQQIVFRNNQVVVIATALRPGASASAETKRPRRPVNAGAALPLG